MPPNGRYKVSVGSSLRRAIKARAGNNVSGTPPKRNNLPDRDFYSFRCRYRATSLWVGLCILTVRGLDNFIPESVDQTKPGSIEVKKGEDNTGVIVEHVGVQVRKDGSVDSMHLYLTHR